MSVPAAKPKEASEEAEDATEALHRMLSGNNARPVGGGSLSMSVPAAKPKEESEEAEDATEALHRMLSGNAPGGGRSGLVAAAAAVEDTSSLHRMLSGNMSPVRKVQRDASKPDEDDESSVLRTMFLAESTGPLQSQQSLRKEDVEPFELHRRPRPMTLALGSPEASAAPTASVLKGGGVEVRTCTHVFGCRWVRACVLYLVYLPY